MKKINIVALLLVTMSMIGCGAIDSGNAGVRTSWQNVVQDMEVNEGFYTSIISSVEEYVGKEIMVPLNDMTPKAGDNLTMQDLDVEIWYTASTSNFSELKVKYANAHIREDGYVYPAYGLIRSQGRSAVYKAVADVDSLLIHKNRDALAVVIKEKLQSLLDVDDPSIFTITKIIVKQAVTDPSLEESIQLNTKKDKEFEAKEKEVQIKEQEALANEALTASLSPNIMRIKELDAMVKACQKNTCIIDFTNGSVKPLINIK